MKWWSCFCFLALFSCLNFSREYKERKAKEARETRKKQGCATRCSLAEEMERYSLATFPHSLSLFPPSLSISYIKIVTFCREMLNTANSLRGSSASCAGLGKRQRHLNRQEKKTEITSEPDWHFTCVGQGTQILRCMIS